MVAAKGGEADNSRCAGIETGTVSKEAVIIHDNHRKALTADELDRDPRQRPALERGRLGIEIDAGYRLTGGSARDELLHDPVLRHANQVDHLKQPDWKPGQIWQISRHLRPAEHQLNHVAVSGIARVM